MRSLSLLAIVAAFAGGAASATAQEPSQPPRPKTPAPGRDECTTVAPGRIECRRVVERALAAGGRLDSAMMKRAALGMQLAATGSARDTLGVFVAAVTPKGPAENAGIVEGDRIVSVNGVDLRVASGDIEDGYASGLPAHRLSREVAKLTPGARVNLRVYSGGRVRDVQVTAARASDLMRSRNSVWIGGDGPGNTFIFRDGMRMPEMPEMPAFPPMAHMSPMPPMPPMDHMRAMELMPRLERLREEMPEMRRMDGAELPRLQELSPEMQRMEGPDLRRIWEMMPEMRRLEHDGPRIRMNEEGLRMLQRSRIRSPRASYRVRGPNSLRKTSPRRMKVEAEQRAKARADSVKKRP